MKISQSLLALSRNQKRALSIFIDVLGLTFISVLAIWIRFGEAISPFKDYTMAIAILPLIAIPIFITQGLYRAVVRYIGFKFAYTVLLSTSLLFVVWAAIIFMLDFKYPRSAILINYLLALFFIGTSRLAVKYLLSEGLIKNTHGERKRVVIYGAGSSGQQLLNTIKRLPAIKVVGFIDDNKQLQKTEIDSYRVHSRDKLQHLIDYHGVSEVFLAIPSLTALQKKNLLTWLEPFQAKILTLPPMDQIIDGQISFSDIREVDIEDLLGRDSVIPKPDLLKKCIQNKVVLISGAGGSIGSELCRQVIQQKPKMLVLYEMSEFALYSIEKELAPFSTPLIAVLGSVLDERKVKQLIQKYNVDTIYHAAAYKHVPIVEHNIQEGIINNSFGTHSLAKVAAETGVKNFVLISTDKAVRPTNFMGASKRLAEMALQALQIQYPHTCFVMVRFGNVLGSSGSVIPLFRKQIAQGGPVTVTHKEITRYFMTIPEAASLVIQAGSMGTGGDVFVLDMGEPVKIADLAAKVIKLSGLSIINNEGIGDIEIKYTGLRPGEKLYEELLIGDNVDGTDHPRIMKAHESFLEYDALLTEFKTLNQAIEENDFEALKVKIGQLVSGFHHTSDIVDYLQE